MKGRHTSFDGRRQWWWLGFASALFLLLPIDLLTTLLSVAAYGTVVEANPLVRALIEHGLLAVTVANLVVAVAVVVAFDAAIDGIEKANGPSRRALAYGVDAWVVALLVGGVALVANNLAALL